MDAKKGLTVFLIAVFSISLVSSIMLTIKGGSGICNINNVNGCDLVGESSYASTFGVKNSTYGVAIFSLLLILALWHFFDPHDKKEAIIDYGIIGGSIIALYFLYLQFIVIKAFCTYCLIIDFLLIIGLVISLLIKKVFKHHWN